MSVLTIKNPKVKVVMVTPKMASEWLLKNTRNRPFSEAKVLEYLKEMKQGEWDLTTDAIGFDTNDELINGQHRLMAVVRYGKAVEFMVATGLEPDAFNVIDTGKVRNAGDVLGANGFGSGHHKSAIIKFVMAYKRGTIMGDKDNSRRDHGINNQDTLDYAIKHRTKLEEAYSVALQVNKDFKGLKGREVGGLFWIFSEIDRNRALVFFGALGTGAMLKQDNPIYVLRQRLLDNLALKKKFPVKDKLAWTIMAWNHSKHNHTLKQIKWNGEKFPKPE